MSFLRGLDMTAGRGGLYALDNVPTDRHPDVRGILRLPQDYKKGRVIYINGWTHDFAHRKVIYLQVMMPKAKYRKFSWEQKEKKRELARLEAQSFARWKARKLAKEPPREIKRSDLG